MSDDLPPPFISDIDLLRLIERATGKPSTFADVRIWRLAIERERVRRSASLAPPPLAADIESAHALIIDMLTSPEARLFVAVLRAACSSFSAIHARMLNERSIAYDLRADLEGLHQYAVEKLAPGGRGVPVWPDPAHALPSLALAALNAATSESLTEWRDRLSACRRAPATRPHLLRRLCAEGREIVCAHRDLDLCRPLPGPPLQIWPPIADSAPAADPNPAPAGPRAL